MSQIHPRRFPKAFRSFYQYIMKPFQYADGTRPGHLDVIIFVERYPNNVWEKFSTQIGENKTYNWMKIERDHRVYPEFLKENRSTTDELEKTTLVYITADSHSDPYPHRILVHLIAVNLPHYIAASVSVIDHDNWLRCATKKWPLQYALSTSLYSSFLLTHHLIQNYDYYIKIDTDIYWISQPPSDPIKDMASGSFIAFHSEVQEDAFDCHLTHHAVMKWLPVYREKMVQKLLLQYAHDKCVPKHADVDFSLFSDPRYNLLNKLPMSNAHPWYNNPARNQYFYSNFIGIWTGWALSEENRWLLDFLFNTFTDGYIKRRWTDQAVWGTLLGFWFNISDLRSDKKIYDLSHWRNKYFRHK